MIVLSFLDYDGPNLLQGPLRKDKRVGWKVHRLTIMQWSNLTKCGFIFQQSLPCGPYTSPIHAIGVAAFGSPWYMEALILILKKVLNCRYDLIIGPMLLPSQVCFFVMRNKQKSDCAKSGEYGGGSTTPKAQSRTTAIASIDLCAGALSSETGLPSSVFQAVTICL